MGEKVKKKGGKAEISAREGLWCTVVQATSKKKNWGERSTRKRRKKSCTRVVIVLVVVRRG